MTDADYMQLALEEARLAAEAGEVPIGAVLAQDGKLVARGNNRTIRDCDPTAHAEIVALREASRVVNNYRLSEMTMYVTLEPCAMCAGAVVLARVDRVVVGAADPKAGFTGSLGNLVQDPRLNHRAELVTGVQEDACSEVLRAFFRDRR